MSEIVPDWWLSPESRLQMPKKEIGDYIESLGIKVAKRYESLDEALDEVRQGVTIIIRSEHPDEYDGPSGLMSSFIVDQSKVQDYLEGYRQRGEFDIDKEIPLTLNRPSFDGMRFNKPGRITVCEAIISGMLNNPTEQTLSRLKGLQSYFHTAVNYASLTGQSVAELFDGVQYSFWEYIPGDNITVVADSSIDDKYHILASDDSSFHWQVANENGDTLAGRTGDKLLTSEVIRGIVAEYETIRNLPRFNSKHCPIMELQIDKSGQIWFLQYHRTRDFKSATESLNPDDFPKSEGWQVVEGVRGYTDSSLTLQTALWYPGKYGSSEMPLPESEEASADWHFDRSLSEVMSRRRLAFVDSRGVNHLYSCLCDNHDTRTKWFKPDVAVSCSKDNFKELVGQDVIDEIQRVVYCEHRMARFVIDLAADGVSGYIRLNRESKQPILTNN